MRKLLLAVVLVALVGCKSSEAMQDDGDLHPLGSEWRPLVDVRVRPDIVRNVGSDTAITTVGRHVYVQEMDDFLSRYVPGSPKYRAVMRHEQEHSIRQFETGVYLWIARYSYDREFALLEERIGYYYEITERRRLGNPMNVDATAIILSRYQNLAGRLISYEEARVWVLDVLAGRWTP